MEIDGKKSPRLWFVYWECCQSEASLYKSDKCISTFYFVPAPLFNCLIFVFVFLQKLLLWYFFALNASSQHSLYLPCCLCFALKGHEPIRAEACDCPRIKRQRGAQCVQIPFPDHSPLFQRWSLPTNLDALLFRAKESYLFSQTYLLYLEKGWSRLPERGSCLQWERSPGCRWLGAVRGCQGALLKW